MKCFKDWFTLLSFSNLLKSKSEAAHFRTWSKLFVIFARIFFEIILFSTNLIHSSNFKTAPLDIFTLKQRQKYPVSQNLFLAPSLSSQSRALDWVCVRLKVKVIVIGQGQVQRQLAGLGLHNIVAWLLWVRLMTAGCCSQGSPSTCIGALPPWRLIWKHNKVNV